MHTYELTSLAQAAADRELILSMLADGPQTVYCLGQACGGGGGVYRARQILDKLETEGCVRRTKAGTWERSNDD